MNRVRTPGVPEFPLASDVCPNTQSSTPPGLSEAACSQSLQYPPGFQEGRPLKPVITVPERLRQEDCLKFQARMDYIAKSLTQKPKLKKKQRGAVEMVQQLRTMAALSAVSSIPSNTAHNHLQWDLMSSSGIKTYMQTENSDIKK